MIDHSVFGFISLESARYFCYSKIYNHYTEETIKKKKPNNNCKDKPEAFCNVTKDE